METRQVVVHEQQAITPQVQLSAHSCVREACRELGEGDVAEALALLAEEPLRAVQLCGLLADYGVQNAALRGRFYGYFEDGRLANVALLGHHILIYRLRPGLQQFADLVLQNGISGHLVLGPKAQVNTFTSHLQRGGRGVRLRSPQLWYVCRRPQFAAEALQLTLATAEQLDEIAEVQAQLVYEQHRVDPRLKDPLGFRERVSERIRRQRTWVRTHQGKLIFKAEMVCESPAAVYIESIWTHPDYRGKGVATRCVSDMVNRFLFRKKAVCLVVEPEEEAARRVYERVGFVYEEDYLAHFLLPIA